MTDFDSPLDRDWGDVWDELAEAPSLSPRAKDAQVTLRMPRQYVTRLKAVARAKSLPYHALARSWLTEDLSTIEGARETAELNDVQINLKMDQDLLDAIKKRAATLRLPYHALARDLIVTRIESEERLLELSGAPRQPLRLGELILLLLDAPNGKGAESILGMTRLQKLLFVVEQTIGSPEHFYAHNYGPFDDAVYDATHALQRAGFVAGGSSAIAGPPNFAYMVAVVERRAGPRNPSPELLVLTPKGREAAERLRQSHEAYEALYARIAAVRIEWDMHDLDELVERIYATWPEYADRSLIRHEVAERARRRRRS